MRKTFLLYVFELFTTLLGLSFGEQTIPKLPLLIGINVIDTSNIYHYSASIRAIWLNDTISLRVLDSTYQFDFVELRKKMRDSNYLKSEADQKEYIKYIRDGYQNCYSFALEQYFIYDEHFTQNAFNKNSNLKGESLEKILSNYFVRIASYSNQKRLLADVILPDKSLVTLVNKYGNVIHAMYYKDGKLYSKNGMLNPEQYDSLVGFLQKYYQDTVKIEIYQLNYEKVKAILSDNVTGKHISSTLTD